ncbi:hypothetical protein Amet_0025 [Alkaliphilus metalliredigens QYMF]|uniref:Uncharacterized protein n=1 Tax=Alkaliphilus metalliredigens (strain QYMF) TaxID=293826 RepID=A6TJA0_ALKMQ|nr:hypothetical protein [Alkaliphilus metalliredigens]ABR46268.1 hypothetical protein Amet_0025 [Alkaliphilus metalliredigens QYMF]
MPFNVCDQNGKHIGILYERCPEYSLGRKFSLVCLTELTTEKININFHGIKDYLARRYDLKTVFGKIKEEKLQEKLEEEWREYYSEYGAYDEVFLLKIHLSNHQGEISHLIEIEEQSVQGYILLNRENVIFHNKETIIIKNELDFIQPEKEILGKKPLYTKVVDYPVISMGVMGLGEGLLLGANLSDFGGRNHIHNTKLKLMVGNDIHQLELPMQINAKRGMTILFYLEGQKIKHMVCDERIYTF